MRENWEQLKTKFKKNPVLFSLVGIGVIFGGYFLLKMIFKPRETNLQEMQGDNFPSYSPSSSSSDTAGETVPSPSGISMSDISSVLEAFGEGIMSNVNEALASQNETIQTLQANTEETFSQMQSSLQENITAKEEILTEQPSLLWAPTSKVIGGTGGGITTGTKEQLDEFNRGSGVHDDKGRYNVGGSRNTGGNHSMESKGWNPPAPPKGSAAEKVKSAFDSAGGGLAGAKAAAAAATASGVW